MIDITSGENNIFNDSTKTVGGVKPTNNQNKLGEVDTKFDNDTNVNKSISNTINSTNNITPSTTVNNTPSNNTAENKTNIVNNNSNITSGNNINNDPYSITDTGNRLLSSEERDLLSLWKDSEYGLKKSIDNNHSTDKKDWSDPMYKPLGEKRIGDFITTQRMENGKYRVTLNSFGIPFTDIKSDERYLGEMSWDPLQAQAVARPMINYAMNVQNYDTKNRIIQGVRTWADSWSGYYNGHDNFVDDYALREWGNAVDMAANWKNRSDMENTMAGLQTVNGFAERFNWAPELSGNISNMMALYSFGNGVYNLQQNWDSMNDVERSAGVLHTIQSGMHAYVGLDKLSQQYNWFGNNAVASASSVTPTVLQSTGEGAFVLSTGETVQGVQTLANGNTLLANGAQITSSGEYIPAAGAGAQGAGWVGNVSAGLAWASAGYSAVNAYRTDYNGKVSDAAAQAGTTAAGQYLGMTGTAALADTAAAGSFAASASYAGPAALIAAGATMGANAASYYSGVHKDKILATGGLAAGLGSGRNTAQDRRNSAAVHSMSGALTGAGIAIASGLASGMTLGATLGSVVPVVGTIIGAAVGAVVGVVTTSGKFGHSREQAHRDMMRRTIQQSNIIQRAENHHFYYVLADGQYYNVGIDGSSGRAMDINAKTKTFYHPELLQAGKDQEHANKLKGEMLPYDIDYTNNLDFTASVLARPLIILGMGGSNNRDQQEYEQMLGYLTNATTSNMGREFTADNFEKMRGNIIAGIQRTGINNKSQLVDSISYLYLRGKVTKTDFNKAKMAANLIYDKNGYQQAQNLNHQAGRDQYN